MIEFAKTIRARSERNLVLKWTILGDIFPVITAKTASDRLVALNVLAGVVLALLVLRGVSQGRSIYLDVALVYDIFGFLGFLAIARFLKDRMTGDGGE